MFKDCALMVIYIEDNTWVSIDIKFIFDYSTRYLQASMNYNVYYIDDTNYKVLRNVSKISEGFTNAHDILSKISKYFRGGFEDVSVLDRYHLARLTK